MGVLDQMIQYASTRKSPLEVLRDKYRQDEMDRMAREQHKATMAMNQVKMQQIGQELQRGQMEMQQKQKMSSLLSQYTDEQGRVDYRGASRAAFAGGDVGLANQIQIMRKRVQEMDIAGTKEAREQAKWEAELAGGGDEPYKPLSPEGKQAADIQAGVPGVAERVAEERAQEQQLTRAKEMDTLTKEQDMANFQLAQIFDFEPGDEPDNYLEVRNRYIELMKQYGDVEAQRMIQKEYDTSGMGMLDPRTDTFVRKQTEGPIQVKSVEEARALPSGTKFITPDGKEMIRP